MEQIQKYLINHGYLTPEDAKGGWGPKTQAAYDSCMMDKKAPKKFDQSLFLRPTDYGVLSKAQASLNDLKTYLKWKGSVIKSKIFNNYNEEGLPIVDMSWDVSKAQLTNLAKLLPDDLTPQSYPYWTGDEDIEKPGAIDDGSRYYKSWDNDEYIESNKTWFTKGLRKLAEKADDLGLETISKYSDLAATSLESPGRGSIGGYSVRTSPLGIYISDAYEFKADPSQVLVTDTQTKGYNDTRLSMNKKYCGENQNTQQYFISWPVYYKLHPKN